MQALTFWKTVTMDAANLLETLIEFLRRQGVRFCVIGGQAVNAYVEPLVSLDLDLAVAVESLEDFEKRLAERFIVKRFPHSLNLSLPGSDLRVQIQTDERYRAFVERASERETLGIKLPVASLEDVLQGKIWAALDPERRGSKRQKDLADIARILESYPHLQRNVPAEVLKRLE
jgi:predicted nucleotidyltransferase